MKQYKKTYENVFTSQRRKKRCNPEKISTDIGLDVWEYRDLFWKTLVDFENSVFEKYARIAWLRQRFCYFGVRRKSVRSNCSPADAAFGIFINNHVGADIRLYNRNIFSCLSLYLDDFFPGFYDRDPFKEKFEYPYKHMRFAHIFFVYQMTERMELLAHGEEKGMPYADFVDYVINYVYCLNEEKGKELYRIATHMIGNNLYVRKMTGKKPYHKLVDMKKV